MLVHGAPDHIKEVFVTLLMEQDLVLEAFGPGHQMYSITIIQTLRAFRQAWKSELAEKHYCILFYMSLVGSVGIVGMDDLF